MVGRYKAGFRETDWNLPAVHMGHAPAAPAPLRICPALLVSERLHFNTTPSDVCMRYMVGRAGSEEYAPRGSRLQTMMIAPWAGEWVS